LAKDHGKRKGAGDTIQVLLEISNIISSSLNLNLLYKNIHRSLGKILNADNFFIALLDEQKDTVTFPYFVDTMDKSPGELSHFTQRATLTGQVIEKKKPLIFKHREILNFIRNRNLQKIGTISRVWMGAPLVLTEKVIGVVSMQDYVSENTYTRKDLDILTSISRHITIAIERKMSDDALKEQSKILEKILESSLVGIALIKDRRFSWVNREFVNILGYANKNELGGRSTRVVYESEEEFERAGKIISSTFSANNKVDFEYNLKRKDGSVFPAHIKISTDDPDDPFSWIIATIMDISARKTVEKEQAEREKLQGVLEMAGAVCHELNQPLQAILGYSDLLMMDRTQNDPEKISRHIDSIKSQTARIGDITRQISSLTRYNTIDYSDNTRIVDIWNCGNRQ
jgi:PAS domain S-box-containing protein